MAFEATFRHGEATKVDYTAGADIVAGQIVKLQKMFDTHDIQALITLRACL